MRGLLRPRPEPLCFGARSALLLPYTRVTPDSDSHSGLRRLRSALIPLRFIRSASAKGRMHPLRSARPLKKGQIRKTPNLAQICNKTNRTLKEVIQYLQRGLLRLFPGYLPEQHLRYCYHQQFEAHLPIDQPLRQRLQL